VLSMSSFVKIKIIELTDQNSDLNPDLEDNAKGPHLGCWSEI